MRRIALVDNAPLTAAQQLLGDIKVKNLYNIDGDIEAKAPSIAQGSVDTKRRLRNITTILRVRAGGKQA